MENVSCIDCKHIRGDDFGFYCESFKAKYQVPYQNIDHPIDVRVAWKKCKGKKFDRRKGFWARIFS